MQTHATDSETNLIPCTRNMKPPSKSSYKHRNQRHINTLLQQSLTLLNPNSHQIGHHNICPQPRCHRTPTVVTPRTQNLVRDNTTNIPSSVDQRTSALPQRCAAPLQLQCCCPGRSSWLNLRHAFCSDQRALLAVCWVACCAQQALPAAFWLTSCCCCC